MNFVAIFDLYGYLFVIFFCFVFWKSLLMLAAILVFKNFCWAFLIFANFYLAAMFILSNFVGNFRFLSILGLFWGGGFLGFGCHFEFEAIFA